MERIVVLFFILLLAAFTDLFWNVIPNWLNIVGYFVGIAYICFTLSYLDAVQRIGISFIIFAVFYFIFKIGCLGAGDIKLLMTASIYVDPKNFLLILLLSLFLAAAISICIMIRQNILWTRLVLFASYLQKCIQNRVVYPYCDSEYEKQVTIHMAVPIFMGFCIWVSLKIMGVVI